MIAQVAYLGYLEIKIDETVKSPKPSLLRKQESSPAEIMPNGVVKKNLVYFQ